MGIRVNYERATRHLSAADPVLAKVIDRHGPCLLHARRSEPRLRALVRALVSQQLSVKAAATIFGRLLALFPGESFPAPDQVLAVPIDQLRGVGLSRQKAAYLRDLCERVHAGTLPLESLDDMPDEAVVQTLTMVKGIGRWTAEMMLIFQLGRPDVLPVDDVGLLRAIQQVYGLRRRPTAARVLRMGESWRPYRSIASWYLWAALDGA